MSFTIHNRIFGPELWTDPFIAQSAQRREVLRATIHLADGFGKLYDSDDLAERIKIMFFPIDADIDIEAVQSTMAELIDRGVLCCYTVDDHRYMHLTKWGRYQQISPSRRGKSTIPDCPKCGPAFGSHTPPVDGGDAIDEPESEEPEPAAPTEPAAPKRKRGKPYTPSTEAVECVNAWRKHDEVPSPDNLDLYHQTFDRMHKLDGLSWTEIHAICNHALTVWLGDGIYVSPTRLRGPSKSFPDMRCWQVIQKQMQTASKATGRNDEPDRVTFDADGLDQMLGNKAAAA